MESYDMRIRLGQARDNIADSVGLLRDGVWGVSALKAYKVGHWIVFAHTAGQAKAKAMADTGYDFVDLRAVRTPQFDQYAESGRVPIQAMLDDGWWFGCHKCYGKVSKDTGEDDPELAPVIMGPCVYHKRCAPKEGAA